MAFEPLTWYCKPFEWACNSIDDGVLLGGFKSAFGAYTICAIDSLVICISHLVLLGLCLNRICRLMNDFSVQRYRLRSNFYNYVLGLLALCCTAEPMFRLAMGISAFNVNCQHDLAPYEACFYCLCCVSIEFTSLLTFKIFFTISSSHYPFIFLFIKCTHAMEKIKTSKTSDLLSNEALHD